MGKGKVGPPGKGAGRANGPRGSRLPMDRWPVPFAPWIGTSTNLCVRNSRGVAVLLSTARIILTGVHLPPHTVAARVWQIPVAWARARLGLRTRAPARRARAKAPCLRRPAAAHNINPRRSAQHIREQMLLQLSVSTPGRHLGRWHLSGGRRLAPCATARVARSAGRAKPAPTTASNT